MVSFNINEEFYQDEERDGFKVSSLMKRCWAMQLQVLEDFDKVCAKHNLKWFAFCGTLLGAVRHKGFIPWDDDMDICMLRGDYNMFLHYAQKEMPGYFIESSDIIHGDGYRNDWMGISRINNVHLANFDPDFLKTHHGFPYTVGLDLYPLDYVPSSDKEYETSIEIFQYILNVAFKYKSLNWKGYKGPKGHYEGIDLDEAYQSLYDATGFKIDKQGDVLKQLNNLAVNISSYTKGKDSEKVACMSHMALGHRNMIFPKDAFKRSVELPFESGVIYAPAEYGQVLTSNYGPGYMTPVNHSPHDYPYYKVQERWVRDYVIKNPDLAPYMTKYYIADVYNEDPEKKELLDKIYERN
jgi:lipopolysaccharide cholinephosphotransferase